MEVFERIAPLREFLTRRRQAGQSIGLVPTMGYFHEGHISLVRRAVDENDCAAVSIFVNPTQFGADEDLASYPRDLERDLRLCDEAGVAVVLTPPAEEMYPQGQPLTEVRVQKVSEGLCGAFRPVHFAGVATVVAKLFCIFQPDRAYFGEKDYQQLVVIRQMARDLNFPVQVVGCPTVREPDGLAMSSRNEYLSEEERQQAPVLSQALFSARGRILDGERSADVIRELVRRKIESAPLANVQYVEVVHPETLAPLTEIDEGAAIAVAVFFGKARLIDNVVVKRK